MKLLNIITLLGIFFISSCKKTEVDACQGSNILTAYLDYEHDINCVTAPCYTVKVTLSTGEVVRFDNLSDYKLEEVDQTIEFVWSPSLTMPAFTTYHIDCIKSKTKKISTGCDNKETIHLKPFEVNCLALNCPQFFATKSDGSEITITNINDFKLSLIEQDVQIGFDGNIIKTDPPQYTAICVEPITPTIDTVFNPNDPLPCDMAVIGTLKNENGHGGCGWLIHLNNGEWVHILNMYGFAGLQIDGATVSVALEYNVDAPTICNKAKPVFILCGTVISNP
jgi:hypothetical protein